MAFGRGCPGARLIREAAPEYVECPHCGGEVEIWTDELLARCPHCRWSVPRERGASCIDWCAHAAECVGEEVYRRLKGGAQ
jgi:Zn finger protein HypA/HybF involved in hydrogenase expression